MVLCRLLGQILNKKVTSNSTTGRQFVCSLTPTEGEENAASYSLVQILLKDDRLPSVAQICECQSSTTSDDIELFAQRAQAFEQTTFVVFGVDMLSVAARTTLSEVQQRLHRDSHLGDLFFIYKHTVAAPAKPWQHLWPPEADEQTDWDEQFQMIAELTRQPDRFFRQEVTSVAGVSGDGKTHFIQHAARECTVISMNDKPNFGKIVQCLNSMPRQGNIFVNVSAHASLPEVDWILLQLLMCGSLRDPEFGAVFSTPWHARWRWWVEIPYRSEWHADLSNKPTRKLLPVLSLLAEEKIICGARYPLCVDPSDEDPLSLYYVAQCTGEYYRRTIDHKCADFANKGITFERKLSAEQVKANLQLLMRDKAPHLKHRFQQVMFLRYLRKRFQFFKNATFAFDREFPRLGSTLFDQFVREALFLCQKDFQCSWVLFEDVFLVIDSSGGSLYSLYQKELRKDIEEITKGGAKLLQQQDAEDTWVTYVAQAIGLQFNQVQRLLRAKEFVLTADFAYKLLLVHERKLARFAVILEGETGVGKTFLLEMYAMLLNEHIQETSNAASAPRIFTRLCHWLHSEVMTSTALMPNLQSPVNKEKWDEYRASILTEEMTEKGLLNAWKWLLLVAGNRTVQADQAESLGRNHLAALLLDFIKRSYETLPLLRVQDSPLPAIAQALSTAEATDEQCCDLLCKLLRAPVFRLLHRLLVHPGTSIEDVEAFLEPVLRMADRERGLEFVVFFDEVNTSSCLGVFKEILIDHMLNGKRLAKNIFFVAAINPHLEGEAQATPRGRPLETVGQTAALMEVTRRRYFVHKLPDVMATIKWQYKALHGESELREYIRMKLDLQEHRFIQDTGNSSFSIILKETFINLLVAAQQFCSAKLKKSAVSQRDIQRVFRLVQFFLRFLPDQQQEEDECIGPQTHFSHSINLAIAVVYYIRLPTENSNAAVCRRDFEQCMSHHGATDFKQIVTRGIDCIVTRDHFRIPSDVALNQALKENIFALLACIQSSVPVGIIGIPGSSKTLSFQVLSHNLRGKESMTRFCQGFDAIDSFFYQCSEHSTANDIKRVFLKAIARQEETYNETAENALKSQEHGLRTRCVVFLDEAGLPQKDKKKMVLKVLHQYLDECKVSFVALSNQHFDDANENRMVIVLRSTATLDDLCILALGCLGQEKPPDKNHPTARLVRGICRGFLKLMDFPDFSELFHYRDLVYTIRHLYRNQAGKQIAHLYADPILFLRALEENFNGMTATRFRFLVDTMFQEVRRELALIHIPFPPPPDSSFRSIIDVVHEVVQGHRSNMQTHINGHQTATGHRLAPRFKMIIDPTNDHSAIRLLQHAGLLNPNDTRIFCMSDLPGDMTELHNAETISNIRFTLEKPLTAVLVKTSRIHGSLFYLLNQNYRILASGDDLGGGEQPEDKVFANIPVGPVTYLCPVNPGFQCLVFVREADLQETPAPFLSRFEKYRLSVQDCLELKLRSLASDDRKNVELADHFCKKFIERLGEKSFYGYHAATTLASLLFSHIKTHPQQGTATFECYSRSTRSLALSGLMDGCHSESQRMIRGLCAELLQLVPPEVFVKKLSDGTFDKQLKEQYASIYFRGQEHFSLSRLLASMGELSADHVEAERTGQDASIGERSADHKDPERTSHEAPMEELNADRNDAEPISQEASVGELNAASDHKDAEPTNQEAAIGELNADHKDAEPTSQDASIGELNADHKDAEPTRQEIETTKLLVFTRSSPALQDVDGLAARLLESLDRHQANKVLVENASRFTRQSDFKKFLKDFSSPSSAKKVCLICANTAKVRDLLIFHRLMCDTKAPNKAFVLLLHFPPSQMHGQPVFTSSFLYGWSCVFLDTCEAMSFDPRHFAKFFLAGQHTSPHVSAGPQATTSEIDAVLSSRLQRTSHTLVQDFCSSLSITHSESRVRVTTEYGKFYFPQTSVKERGDMLELLLRQHPAILNRVKQLFSPSFGGHDLAKEILKRAREASCGLANEIERRNQSQLLCVFAYIASACCTKGGLVALMSCEPHLVEPLVELIPAPGALDLNKTRWSIFGPHRFLPKTPLLPFVAQRMAKLAHQVDLKRSDGLRLLHEAVSEDPVLSKILEGTGAKEMQEGYCHDHVIATLLPHSGTLRSEHLAAIPVLVHWIGLQKSDDKLSCCHWMLEYEQHTARVLLRTAAALDLLQRPPSLRHGRTVEQFQAGFIEDAAKQLWEHLPKMMAATGDNFFSQASRWVAAFRTVAPIVSSAVMQRASTFGQTMATEVALMKLALPCVSCLDPTATKQLLRKVVYERESSQPAAKPTPFQRFVNVCAGLVEEVQDQQSAVRALGEAILQWLLQFRANPSLAATMKMNPKELTCLLAILNGQNLPQCVNFSGATGRQILFETNQIFTLAGEGSTLEKALEETLCATPTVSNRGRARCEFVPSDYPNVTGTLNQPLAHLLFWVYVTCKKRAGHSAMSLLNEVQDLCTSQPSRPAVHAVRCQSVVRTLLDELASRLLEWDSIETSDQLKVVQEALHKLVSQKFFTQTTVNHLHEAYLVKTVIHAGGKSHLLACLKSEAFACNNWAQEILRNLHLNNSALCFETRFSFMLTQQRSAGSVFRDAHDYYSQFDKKFKESHGERNQYKELQWWCKNELKSKKRVDKISVASLLKAFLLLKIYHDYFSAGRQEEVRQLWDMLEQLDSELRMLPWQSTVFRLLLVKSAKEQLLPPLWSLFNSSHAENWEARIRDVMINQIAWFILLDQHTNHWVTLLNRPDTLLQTMFFGAVMYHGAKLGVIKIDCCCQYNASGQGAGYSPILPLRATHMTTLFSFSALVWHVLNNGKSAASKVLSSEFVRDDGRGNNELEKTLDFCYVRVAGSFRYLQNLGKQDQCSPEQVGLLLTRSLEQLLQLHLQGNVAFHTTYTTPQSLEAAERQFTDEVFQCTVRHMDQYKHETDTVSSERTKLQRNIDLFPRVLPPSLLAFEDAFKLLPDEEKDALPILKSFFANRPMLRFLGILPPMVDFYLWLLDNFSHQPINMEGEISQKLQELSANFPEKGEQGDELYKCCEASFAKYYNLTGGLLRPGACDDATPFFPLTKSAAIGYVVKVLPVIIKELLLPLKTLIDACSTAEATVDDASRLILQSCSSCSGISLKELSTVVSTGKLDASDEAIGLVLHRACTMSTAAADEDDELKFNWSFGQHLVLLHFVAEIGLGSIDVNILDQASFVPLPPGLEADLEPNERLSQTLPDEFCQLLTPDSLANDLAFQLGGMHFRQLVHLLRSLSIASRFLSPQSAAESSANDSANAYLQSSVKALSEVLTSSGVTHLEDVSLESYLCINVASYGESRLPQASLSQVNGLRLMHLREVHRMVCSTLQKRHYLNSHLSPLLREPLPNETEKAAKIFLERALLKKGLWDAGKLVQQMINTLNNFQESATQQPQKPLCDCLVLQGDLQTLPQSLNKSIRCQHLSALLRLVVEIAEETSEKLAKQEQTKKQEPWLEPSDEDVAREMAARRASDTSLFQADHGQLPMQHNWFGDFDKTDELGTATGRLSTLQESFKGPALQQRSHFKYPQRTKEELEEDVDWQLSYSLDCQSNMDTVASGHFHISQYIAEKVVPAPSLCSKQAGVWVLKRGSDSHGPFITRRDKLPGHAQELSSVKDAQKDVFFVDEVGRVLKGTEVPSTTAGQKKIELGVVFEDELMSLQVDRGSLASITPGSPLKGRQFARTTPLRNVLRVALQEHEFSDPVTAGLIFSDGQLLDLNKTLDDEFRDRSGLVTLGLVAGEDLRAVWCKEPKKDIRVPPARPVLLSKVDKLLLPQDSVASGVSLRPRPSLVTGEGKVFAVPQHSLRRVVVASSKNHLDSERQHVCKLLVLANTSLGSIHDAIAKKLNVSTMASSLVHQRLPVPTTSAVHVLTTRLSDPNADVHITIVPIPSPATIQVMLAEGRQVAVDLHSEMTMQELVHNLNKQIASDKAPEDFVDTLTKCSLSPQHKVFPAWSLRHSPQLVELTPGNKLCSLSLSRSMDSAGNKSIALSLQFLLEANGQDILRHLQWVDGWKILFEDVQMPVLCHADFQILLPLSLKLQYLCKIGTVLSITVVPAQLARDCKPVAMRVEPYDSLAPLCLQTASESVPIGNVIKCASYLLKMDPVDGLLIHHHPGGATTQYLCGDLTPASEVVHELSKQGTDHDCSAVENDLVTFELLHDKERIANHSVTIRMTLQDLSNCFTEREPVDEQVLLSSRASSLVKLAKKHFQLALPVEEVDLVVAKDGISLKNDSINLQTACAKFGQPLGLLVKVPHYNVKLNLLNEDQESDELFLPGFVSAEQLSGLVLTRSRVEEPEEQFKLYLNSIPVDDEERERLSLFDCACQLDYKDGKVLDVELKPTTDASKSTVAVQFNGKCKNVEVYRWGTIRQLAVESLPTFGSAVGEEADVEDVSILELLTEDG